MNRTLISSTLASALLLGGCSGGSEDVRITFCKDLTAMLTSQQDFSWSEPKNDTPRFADLTTSLDYTVGDNKGNVSCVYELEESEESSLADFQPLDPYATLPHKVTLNGQSIGGETLGKAIHDTLIKQGKDAIETIKKGGNKAVRELSNTLKAALEKS